MYIFFFLLEKILMMILRILYLRIDSTKKYSILFFFLREFSFKKYFLTTMLRILCSRYDSTWKKFNTRFFFFFEKFFFVKDFLTTILRILCSRFDSIKSLIFDSFIFTIFWWQYYIYFFWELSFKKDFDNDIIFQNWFD